MAVYTIGHSTRSIDKFISLLAENDVTHLIDIRAYPHSRTNPQFNTENLQKEMPVVSIDYDHMRSLGGRRKESKQIAPSPNTYWKNKSFRNYADYALSDDFQEGFAKLKRLCDKSICAIMCSEAVWWRCHRRIVADYLLADGYEVVHIMGAGQATPAMMTQGGRITENGLITYDKVETVYRKNL